MLETLLRTLTQNWEDLLNGGGGARNNQATGKEQSLTGYL